LFVNQDTTDRSDWLESLLQQQAEAFDCQLTKDGANRPAPAVAELRERNLRHRELRARRISYASSGLLVLTVVGWSWHSRKSVVAESAAQSAPIANVVTVSADSPGATGVDTGTDARVEGQQWITNPVNKSRVYATWRESVPVEWIDAEGHSLGFAGFVAEEHSSIVDPNSLSADDRYRVRRTLTTNQPTPYDCRFSDSTDSAF
jgi:hypothetical protein